MQVGEATTVRYANAEAIEVIIPMITGSPPISRMIGPSTATVAALLSKLVNRPVTITETNHLTIAISLKIISK